MILYFKKSIIPAGDHYKNTSCDQWIFDVDTYGIFGSPIGDAAWMATNQLGSGQIETRKRKDK